MFVLIEILPLEAMPDHDDSEESHDDWTGVNVIAADESEAALQEFLQDYRQRHEAACREWDEWDAKTEGDWNSEHDQKFDELADKYGVISLMNEVRFKILESLV